MSNGPSNPDQLTFWWADAPAKHSPSQDSGAESPTHAEDSPLPFLKSLGAFAPDGSCTKMSPASLRLTTERRLAVCSGGFRNSGFRGHTESWTLNIAEHTEEGLTAPSRNAAGGCSSLVTLSEILETEPVPPRFSLSGKACSGILARSQRRGRELPPMLKQALEQACGGTAATAPEP